MKGRRTILGLLLCLVVFFYAGCGSEDNSDTVNKYDENNKIKIYLITMDKDAPYWKSLDEGCRQAVEESGIVDYEWIAPVERNVVQQARCIDRAISDNVDAILISAVSDTGLNDNLTRVDKLGIKIIYVDSAATYESVATLMTDNNIAGKTAGETILRAFRERNIESGTVGIIASLPDALNTSLRDKGFRSVFEGTQFKVAPTIYTNGDRQIAKKCVEEHADYAGFFCANQTSTLFAGEQIKNSGSKQVIVGFDVIPETLELVKEGVIYATMKQNTARMGKYGIEIAVKSVEGKYNKKNVNIDTGVTIITNEEFVQNVD